jgi:23S rRNA (uridine2552-2'-O)-methyltransferase
MARRVLHDTFFKQAKSDGYVARSAYKLQQIQEHRPIIRKGDWVLDLGCAPGAWLQVASEITGPTGVVVGIDLQQVIHRFPASPPIVALQGDIYKTAASVLVGAARGAAGVSEGAGGSGGRDRFDAVISDMAPNTSGHGDHERSIALCERAVELLPDLLRHGGNCTMKVFEGGDYPRFLKDVGKLFEAAKGFKPEASRSMSREIYIVATGYKATGTPGGARSGGLPKRVPNSTDSLTRPERPDSQTSTKNSPP